MLQTIKISNNKEAVEEWITDFEDYTNSSELVRCQ